MVNYLKQHDENKQVSLTGARAFIMLLAMVERPRNFEEFKDLLLECKVVDKEYSIDTIRIDINTLKAIGCDISKATKKNNHKYGIIDQPFRFILTPSEVQVLKNIYRKYAQGVDLSTLLDFHKLFIHMSEMVKEEDIKEQLLGISLLKSENIKLLEELVINEKKHNKIIIMYKPANSEVCKYEITIVSVEIRNNKLYIFCHNHTTGKRMMLNTSRVKSIEGTMFDRGSKIGFETIVKFKLKSHKVYDLEENEVILDQNDKDALVEGHYFNEFIAIQRMLSFGSDCTIEEPIDIKDKVLTQLKEMRAIYGM